MRSVLVDKIASVALAADLTLEIRVSDDIPCEEGVLIAVEVLNNKSHYNTLELTSGRMAQIKRGDVIVGALGHRKALFGYSGHLPTELKPGDVVQLLNLGGASDESTWEPAFRRSGQESPLCSIKLGDGHEVLANPNADARELRP